MIQSINESTPAVPSTIAIIDFAYTNGKDGEPRKQNFGFSDRGDRKAAASLVTAVKALAAEENGETTDGEESVPLLKMPVPRKAPQSQISTLTPPNTIFWEMVNYKMENKRSELDYSPTSSISPTNTGGDVKFYSPVENPWDEGKLFSLQEVVIKKIFFDAAKEFSDGIDVESLFEDVNTLEDHDAMKVADSMYELEPHRARVECHCHHCEVAKNAIDLEEHDRNLWCPCTKCEVWKLKEDRGVNEETVQKDANSWRCSTMRALRPPVSSADPSACVDQTDLNFMNDDSDSIHDDKSNPLGGLFRLVRSNLETDDEEEEDDDLWAQKLQVWM
jgi:hypothetical protein